MGCLEQGNPLISRLGDEGVLCVIGGRGESDRSEPGYVPGVAVLCVAGRGGALGGGHLLPDGAHLLGGFLQRAAVIDNPGCDRLTLLVGCLRGDAGARILLSHAA